MSGSNRTPGQNGTPHKTPPALQLENMQPSAFTTPLQTSTRSDVFRWRVRRGRGGAWRSVLDAEERRCLERFAREAQLAVGLAGEVQERQASRGGGRGVLWWSGDEGVSLGTVECWII